MKPGLHVSGVARPFPVSHGVSSANGRGKGASPLRRLPDFGTPESEPQEPDGNDNGTGSNVGECVCGLVFNAKNRVGGN